MMTALLVAERRGPHERVRITRRAVHTGGSAVGVLPKGKQVQLEALLNGLLLVSGNDAAVALAQHIGGSVPGFVRMMNERARQLGLSLHALLEPHGLEDKGNHSCAADLATLARADLHMRRIRRIVAPPARDREVPDQGRKALPLQQQPADALGLPGRDRPEDRLHRPRRAARSSRPRGGTESSSASCCCTPTTRATRRPKLLDRGFKAVGAGR